MKHIGKKIRAAVQRLNDIFDAERLRQRNRYLVSVKDSQRAELIRLREENLRLRELARIAPGAEVPKPAGAFAWVKACDIQRACGSLPDYKTSESVYGFPSRSLEYDEDQPCTCPDECGVGCKGQCGCKACHRNYMDFLSGE